MANLLTIFENERFGPIRNNLTAMLPIKDIIALTRTCRQLSPLYRTLLSRKAWDINSQLKRFVQDPKGLRKRLAELDGIISGGFALQFMDRTVWEDSDLDICIQAGEKAEDFNSYMQKVEGYDLASRKVGKYDWTHVDMVYQYDKEVGDEIRRIEVIVTVNHPIHSTLATYTTALVNVITWDHAYCLFPMSTLIQRQTFPTRIPNYFNGTILAKKYQRRGWNFIQRWPKEGEMTGELELRHRQIGDKFTWKVPLSVETEEADARAQGVVDGLGFEMSKRQDEGLEWLSLNAMQLYNSRFVTADGDGGGDMEEILEIFMKNGKEERVDDAFT